MADSSLDDFFAKKDKSKKKSKKSKFTADDILAKQKEEPKKPDSDKRDDKPQQQENDNKPPEKTLMQKRKEVIVGLIMHETYWEESSLDVWVFVMGSNNYTPATVNEIDLTAGEIDSHMGSHMGYWKNEEQIAVYILWGIFHGIW